MIFDNELTAEEQYMHDERSMSFNGVHITIPYSIMEDRKVLDAIYNHIVEYEESARSYDQFGVRIYAFNNSVDMFWEDGTKKACDFPKRHAQIIKGLQADGALIPNEVKVSLVVSLDGQQFVFAPF